MRLGLGIAMGPFSAPPEEPVDPSPANLFANSVSLYGFNEADGFNGATDEGAVNRGISGFIGNGQIDTAQSKFGTGSALFDGNGDYLNVPASTDFVFDGDYTVDCWARAVDFVNSTMGFMGRYTSATGGRSWSLRYAGGNLQMLQSFDGSTPIVIGGAFTFPTTEWVHVAATRKDGVVRVFGNGELIASATSAGTLFDTSGVMAVGIYDRNAATTGFKGHIDEVEILKGVARWDAAFTPPTEAYQRSA